MLAGIRSHGTGYKNSDAIILLLVCSHKYLVFINVLILFAISNKLTSFNSLSKYIVKAIQENKLTLKTSMVYNNLNSLPNLKGVCLRIAFVRCTWPIGNMPAENAVGWYAGLTCRSGGGGVSPCENREAVDEKRPHWQPLCLGT